MISVQIFLPRYHAKCAYVTRMVGKNTSKVTNQTFFSSEESEGRNKGRPLPVSIRALARFSTRTKYELCGPLIPSVLLHRDFGKVQCSKNAIPALSVVSCLLFTFERDIWVRFWNLIMSAGSNCTRKVRARSNFAFLK